MTAVDGGTRGLTAIIDPRGSTASNHDLVVQHVGAPLGDRNAAPAKTDRGPLQNLRGKKLGIVTTMDWQSWHLFRGRLEDFLASPELKATHERYQDDKPYIQERYDKIAAEVDAAVVGLGNCGSCTASVAATAIEIASRGVPVVCVITEGFRTLADAALEFRDYSHLPVLSMPADYESMTEGDIIRIADERIAELESIFINQSRP